MQQHAKEVIHCECGVFHSTHTRHFKPQTLFILPSVPGAVQIDVPKVEAWPAAYYNKHRVGSPYLSKGQPTTTDPVLAYDSDHDNQPDGLCEANPHRETIASARGGEKGSSRECLTYAMDVRVGMPRSCPT